MQGATITDKRSGAIQAKLLIVEDEPLIALGLASALTDAGFKVLATPSTGEEAISAARLQRPDVALIDVKLRGTMNGVATARVIGVEHGVPIIFVTGAVMDEPMLKLLESSPTFSGVVFKPYSVADLLEPIRKALVASAVPTVV